MAILVPSMGDGPGARRCRALSHSSNTSMKTARMSLLVVGPEAVDRYVVGTSSGADGAEGEVAAVRSLDAPGGPLAPAVSVEEQGRASSRGRRRAAVPHRWDFWGVGTPRGPPRPLRRARTIPGGSSGSERSGGQEELVPQRYPIVVRHEAS